jgi:HK97 family phage portal protein
MNPVKIFQTGLAAKAAGINDLPFPNLPMTWLPSRQLLDTRKVGDGLTNSAAFAVVTSMGRAYAEPNIREYVRSEGQEETLDESATADLIAEPNPYMESDLLWVYAVAAIASSGAAYLHKVRNLAGKVIQLWPLYPAFISPHTPSDGSVFLDYWTYTVPGRAAVKIPADDIVQLRWLINRFDHRLGWAPLGQVLTELLQDDEASLFSTALLTNLGVPGVILTPADPSDPGPQGKALEAMKQDYRDKFGGTKRGEPLVIGGGSMKVSVVSFSPEQMDLTALRRLPEERISGALGWPAILAGLGAGLEHATYANVDGLREFSTESTLIPLWRLTAKQLTRQLLREAQPDTSHRLGFDLSEVRALSQDEDAMVKRLDTAIQGGWALVSEGRRSIGLPVEPEHEVFLRSVSQMAVGMNDDATEEFNAGDETVGSV